MTRASVGRRTRKLSRKRLSSKAVQSVSPKDPKLEVNETVSSSSEAVKPAAPLVRLYVATMLDVAAMNRKDV